ncbi:MAG: LamG-like jellyroll fold domain-containing protein [Bacilli bacterium]
MIIKNKNKSFTLIELLVVIVIIGILAGVIMISTSSSIDKANIAKTQALSNTVQEELLLNLVSEWTFDEGTDQTINRIATNNDVKDTWGSNNGTVNGNPQIKGGGDCVSGKCMSFDGQDDFVYFGTNNNLRMTASQTFSFWYKYNLVSDFDISRGLLGGSSFSSNINCGHAIAININGYIFSDIYSGDPYGNHRSDLRVSAPKDTNWHFIVSGYDTSTNKHFMYLDGVIRTKTPGFLNYKIDWGNNAFRIANTSTTSLLSGLIDDVRIYNAALSLSQIKQNYIAGLNSMLANGNISKEEYNERINTLAHE